MNQGKGGLERVVIGHAATGASAEVYLLGAHLTSFIPKRGGADLLFVSQKAEFAEGKAIRGGVPIIFPQFSDMGPLTKHGFARTALWEVASAADSEVTLVLRSSEATRKLWPHDFEALFRIALVPHGEEAALETEFTVKNTGSSAFAFTVALHTYFAVKDIHVTRVEGLHREGEDLYYLDNTQGRKKIKEESRDVGFTGETDRIYLHTADELRLNDTERAIVIKKSGLADAVVWNVWADKVKSMADLGDDEWPRYACVEVAAVEHPVQLNPQQSWTGKQTLYEQSRSRSPSAL